MVPFGMISMLFCSISEEMKEITLEDSLFKERKKVYSLKVSGKKTCNFCRNKMGNIVSI